MEPAPAAEDCLDDDTAVAFVEGLLSEERIARVEAHIDRCATCRQHLVGMVRARSTAAAPPADREHVAHGTRLGRYEIRRVVGVGSMGVVYAAYDTELRRDVALKMLRADTTQQRLLREAHALARLRHPNVVTVHDIGTARDRVFVVMELVAGTTLTEYLRRAPRRDEIVRCFAQAARGLHAAHVAGVVHRDFKPDNVLVGEDGRVCVTDFGLARGHDEVAEPAGDASDANGAFAATLTHSGAIVGTPAYMAPEQHLGRATNARSDQFSFCVALYEALVGHRPFEGRDLQELARHVTTGTITRGPNDRRLPRRLARLIARGLEADPAQRHESLVAIAEQLEAVHRPRRWPGVALGAAIVSVAAAIGLFVRGGDATESCARSASLVDDVWAPADRLAVVSRFAAQRPQEAVMIDTATRGVDEWADSWRLARRTACAAEPAQRAARIGCLDQELAELRAQLAVWRTGDGEVVDRALGAIASLPQPTACDAHAVRALDPAISELIARVHALERAGEHRRAEGELAPLLAQAEAAGNPADLAAALVAAGHIEQDLGKLDLARSHLTRAAKEAGRAADDAMLFDALITESSVVIDQGRPLDSLGTIGAAEALAVRAGLDRTEALARNRGAALTAAGKAREGIAELQRGLDAVSARAQRDPSAQSEVAAVLAGIAAAEISQFQYERAHALLERTLAIEQTVFGPQHPELGKTLHDLATTEARLGQYDDSLAHLHRARAIFVAAYGEHHVLVGMSDEAVASTQMQQGKVEEAHAAFERASVELAPVLPRDHPTIAVVEDGLGLSLAKLDRCKEAIPHYERALAIYQATGHTGLELANERVNYGSCLDDVGRIADARVAIERALAEMETAAAPELDRAEAWAVLSELEWKQGQRDQAIALARKVLALTAHDDRADIAAVHTFVAGELVGWNGK